jgi:hypothetical protein
MHSFEAQYGSQVVHFEVLELDRSVYVWVGLASHPVMRHLQLHTGEASANVLGNSHALAERLAKRLGQFVYLAMNLPEQDQDMTRWAEHTIAKHFTKLY